MYQTIKDAQHRIDSIEWELFIWSLTDPLDDYDQAKVDELIQERKEIENWIKEQKGE